MKLRSPDDQGEGQRTLANKITCRMKKRLLNYIKSYFLPNIPYLRCAVLLEMLTLGNVPQTLAAWVGYSKSSKAANSSALRIHVPY